MSQSQTGSIELQHPHKLFINGKWVAPEKEGLIEIVSPHTGQVAATVAEATEGDMDKAAAAARAAFDHGPWASTTPEQRAEYLAKMLAYLGPRAEYIAECATVQIGILRSAAPMMTGVGLMALEFMAGGAGGFKFVEPSPAMDPATKGYVVHEPVGVAVAIAPWNAPFSTMICKVAPALLAGCTVIMKPSPETPLDSYLIAEAGEAAGLPAGVLNLVTGHRDASDHLVKNPAVDKVSFTGSTVAGKQIGQAMAARIGRFTLELGGKSAAIIREDFDLQTAAKMLTSTITLACGQVCMTLSRALVPKHLQAELAAAIAKEMAQVNVGDPYDPAAQMGPLAMKRQADRVRAMIQSGIAEGATLAFGGGMPEGVEGDCYIQPTLFTDVDNTMTIAQEEIFGPVLCLIGYEDEADAIRIANESNYGLFGSVLTHDVDKAYQIARKMRTGTIAQGGFRLDFTLPFGGFKQSGVGREGGVSSLKGFTETKAIILESEPSAL